jgi:haloalkane dehalogenase
VSTPDASASIELRKRGDGGRAYPKIRRGFALTAAKRAFFTAGLAARDYPAQVVRGRNDPALGSDRRDAVRRALRVDTATLPTGRHFLPEEPAPAIADAVAGLAGTRRP